MGRGDTLEAYLVKNVKNPALLQSLAAEFVRVVANLERLGVSHGEPVIRQYSGAPGQIFRRH